MHLVLTATDAPQLRCLPLTRIYWFKASRKFLCDSRGASNVTRTFVDTACSSFIPRRLKCWYYIGHPTLALRNYFSPLDPSHRLNNSRLLRIPFPMQHFNPKQDDTLCLSVEVVATRQISCFALTLAPVPCLFCLIPAKSTVSYRGCITSHICSIVRFLLTRRPLRAHVPNCPLGLHSLIPNVLLIRASKSPPFQALDGLAG
jgi:hypothetical protein